MAESIKKRLAAMSGRLNDQELRPLIEAILVDLTAVRTAVTNVTAALDADANVAANNYASTCDPAALTLTS